MKPSGIVLGVLLGIVRFHTYSHADFVNQSLFGKDYMFTAMILRFRLAHHVALDLKQKEATLNYIRTQEYLKHALQQHLNQSPRHLWLLSRLSLPPARVSQPTLCPSPESRPDQEPEASQIPWPSPLGR